jgi:ABC-type dipeptide/oligopeptide/nickel transport system permease subunit
MTTIPARRWARRAAATLLAAVACCALLADFVAPCPYQQQFRDAPNAPPSRQFPMGTDDLGRDRLSRLIYGTRTSLFLAPAAALLTLAGALLAGGLAALGGRRVDTLVSASMDLFLSLPWLFLLLTVRSLLPLDVAPTISVLITFGLLGLLGWAGPARVVRGGMWQALRSDYVLAARGRGVGWAGILWRHVVPNLRPLLAAQFWTAVPLFILAEANLGLLGLGVTEPLPSWGSLLHELESQVAGWSSPLQQIWLLAPIALLLAVVLGLRLVFPAEVTE